MKRFSNYITLAFLFLFACTSLQAQIPAGYYNSAQGKTGDALKVALHNIIKGHHTVSYNGLLDAYAYTDCYSDNKIWDIYSNKHWSLNNDCGQYDEEGDCWNREHTWPSSWFNDQTTPRCDLFHVMPTDGYVNNQRSNYPYGEVSHPTYTSSNGSKLGPCSTPGYTSKVFEPIDEYKGDVARNYFYMSVRYYSEDSGWKSSGMTNKSVIKDWAMTMLLRWHEQDPVSQKEIDRNNAVYGYQNNRNPFIDHPEYAEMIWDPNWTEGNAYNITCATGLANGNISAPETALEGTTVAITATPNPGYMVNSYSVFKTGAPSITVAVSSNGTFTMPAYDVTVSATFVENNTYFHITTAQVSHGSISVSTDNAKSGTTITMTANPENGYHLYSWYVYKTGDMNTSVYAGTNNTFTMPAYDVTVNASFTNQNTESQGDFIKVKENLSDWSGEYLIVYEDGQVAFNGGLTSLDVANNTINVDIIGDTIKANTANLGARFTIAKTGTDYTIRSASGFYIGRTGDSNGINSSPTETYTNSISYTNNATEIASSSEAHLRFNNASDQYRFRYYKSSTYINQKAIQLYKRTVNVAVPTHTIHFNPNGATGDNYEQTVEEYISTALLPNTFSREGFEFDGWNTQANGEGTYYADGATILLTDDIDLYAQWNPKYDIILVQADHGTISASAEAAVAETTITLTATPEAGYELDFWSVTEDGGNTVTVTEDQFEMPADNVTVTASFSYVGLPLEAHYYKVTSDSQLIAGRTYLIVNTDANKALSTTQNNNNRGATSVSITGDTIFSISDEVCTLTLGETEEGYWTLFDAQWDSNGGYLYAASSSNNHLRTQAALSDNGKWTITINDDYTADIVAQGANTRNILRYNNGSTIFSCYASGQQAVTLFIRSEEYTHHSSETIANIFYFDKHTVKDDVTLTVSGNANSVNPGMLVLEEGAQLIHHNDGVKATHKTTITNYTPNTDGGWHTIASPFTAHEPNSEMISSEFDLYAYDEDADLEWINHKSHPFSITPGTGYLYAHNPEITIREQGTLNNGDLTQTIDLSWANTAEDIRGYNLLGNPTAHDIQFSTSDEVSDGYYYLNHDNNWTYEPSNTVPVGRGFLVKANSAGQSVTLNTQEESKASTPICLCIDGESTYVKTGKGVSMPRLSFNGKKSKLYLQRGDKDYVMLVRDQAESIGLCYQPDSQGTHTLHATVDPETTSYLHLIDHMTGADIDLLKQPVYRFQSRENDYPSRFQLRFSLSSKGQTD